MKCLKVSLLTLCVLMVPLVDCQWYRPMTQRPERRVAVQPRFPYPTEVKAPLPIRPVQTYRVQSRFPYPSAEASALPLVRPAATSRVQSLFQYPTEVTAPPSVRTVPTSPVTRRPAPAPPTPGPNGLTILPENDSKVSHMVVEFMMRISRTLTQQNSKTELFSPISIANVANLLFLGSRGVTHEEFGRVLTPTGMNWKNFQQRYGGVLANLLSAEPVDSKRDQWRRQTCPANDDYEDEPSTPEPKSQVIRVANGIFHQNTMRMKPNYVKIVRDFYGALVQEIDSRNPAGSTAIINRWVSDVTAGKIRNMLEAPLNPSSSVVVVNALYFKGKWKNAFEPLVTRPASFFPDGYDGPSYRVPQMSLSGCLPFYKTPDAMQVSIVGLPYRDDTSTMYLIQPANSSRNAVRRLQATLTAKLLDSWIGKMRLQSTMVRMPKMHLKNSIDLLQSFQRLGFTSILSPAKSNLTNMVEPNGGQRPYVNQIMHKVDLAIDEEGTEGAAATSALVDRIGSQQSFNGNTPFLIYLRHDATGLPLFYGPIFDPR